MKNLGLKVVKSVNFIKNLFPKKFSKLIENLKERGLLFEYTNGTNEIFDIYKNNFSVYAGFVY
jgi:hypothetical protein